MAAIAVMGLLDLILTATYMSGQGMYESNPIVVWLMRQSGSVVALAAFKIICLGAAAAALFLVRMYRVGEVGAWAGVALNLFVLGNWMLYIPLASEIRGLGSDMHRGAQWVHVPGSGQ